MDGEDQSKYCNSDLIYHNLSSNISHRQIIMNIKQQNSRSFEFQFYVFIISKMYSWGLGLRFYVIVYCDF